MELFNNKGAIFDDERRYRYVLWREWDSSLPVVGFIGLNPSTANEDTNDATIKRVIRIAQNNGYGKVYMLNLFSIVSRYPNVLVTAADPLRDNDRYLTEYGGKCTDIIFCWGVFKQALARAEVVKKMFPNAKALNITKDGHPQHPLFIKGDTKPFKYE